MDQPGKVANSACGQLNREMHFSLPRSHLRIWSGEKRSVVPSCVGLPDCSFSTFGLNLVLTYGISPAFYDGVH